MDTNANLISIGEQAPDFTLVDKDLNNVTLADCHNMSVLLNVYPSLDTQTCYKSIGGFLEKLDKVEALVVLGVSMDLPFAIGRAKIMENEDKTSLMKLVSDFRTRQFGTDYGLTIINGPLAGLLSRSVILLNSDHKVVYTEAVVDLGNEPNYDAAYQAIIDM